MHEDLVKQLRGCAEVNSLSLYKRGLMKQAADAIEELQAYVALYKDGGETAVKVANDYKARIEELSAIREEQKAQIIAMAGEDKPRWIPVRERLPSTEKEVYVTDGEYIARAILLDEVFPGDKPCWSYSGLGEITHWCEQIPLPEPQKEET